jgi:UDP-N-acetylglucosamine 2-epimerase (non-hydrolysing)
MGMPEEINRILTDQLSDILWTPSKDGNQNLLREGIDESKISFVGNLMIDTLVTLSPQIDAIDIHSIFPEIPEKYGLITLHRPANVDNPVVLEKILRKIQELSLKYDIVMVFPVHPRTRGKLNHEKIANFLGDNNSFILLDPIPYLRFMALVKRSRFLITDSGGIQEETTFLGIPCFTLRPNTERPITISEGSNVLVTPDNLLRKFEHTVAASRSSLKVPDYWDGKSAERVVKDIIHRYHSTN